MHFTAEFTLIDRIGMQMPAWHCVVKSGRTGKLYGATDTELDTALIAAVDTMDLAECGSDYDIAGNEV